MLGLWCGMLIFFIDIGLYIIEHISTTFVISLSCTVYTTDSTIVVIFTFSVYSVARLSSVRLYITYHIYIHHANLAATAAAAAALLT